MNRAKIALVTLAAAAVVPIAMAAPASANTSSGCTVKPLRPNFTGSFTTSGVKKVDYGISVSCAPNRTVSIEQRRYEEDGGLFNSDDFLGASSFNTFGVRTLSNVRTLVDTESGNEEIYHKVRFRVTSNGVTSAWTPWEKSPVLSIPN
jgi:hypothetical protein